MAIVLGLVGLNGRVPLRPGTPPGPARGMSALFAVLGAITLPGLALRA
ncbi:hypothetical protein [Kitasatospora sp. NPDC007106]